MIDMSSHDPKPVAGAPWMPAPLAANGPEVYYAWRGSSLLVLDPQGWMGENALSGYYFRQARFLSALRLELNGEAPWFCSRAQTAPNEIELAYIFPEVVAGGGGGSGSGGDPREDGLLYRNFDLRLRYRVHPSSLEVTLRITNRWQERVDLGLAWVLAADYATVDEAQFGQRRERAGGTAERGEGRLAFRFDQPGLDFVTEAMVDAPGWTAEPDRLRAHLTLLRHETQEVRLAVRALDGDAGIDAAAERIREGRLASWYAATAVLRSEAGAPLAAITNRAVEDIGSLTLLEGPRDEWLVPGAGVPLYLTVWARDALTCAWQAGIFDGGDMLCDVVRFLERRQGVKDDVEHDEEPGRILNQAKLDPLSRLGKTPFRGNYADFASPFMFVIGAGYRYVLTGDKVALRSHWEAMQRVLGWARDRADRDGDGYLEYFTASSQGPTHQGWKDSENAIVDENGHQVGVPIATCEVQGYYYAALQFAAVMSGLLGERRAARSYWRQARRLKERFNRDFWMEDEGCVALGLDADKRQIRAVTSNAGHCLVTGIVSGDHIPRLVARLFAPDMFSGWGIRTLSTFNPAYNPLDYHLGSVWPVENATILFGLRRYGFNDRAIELAGALYDLARMWPGGRIPECVGGYSRAEAAHPGTYPRANRPQTWNQSGLPLMIQSLLGMVPYAPLRLLLVDPVLPPWLPELTVEGVRVGDARATIRFWRDARGKARFRVLEKEGKLRVIRQPWIESTDAGVGGRLGALARSVFRRR